MRLSTLALLVLIVLAAACSSLRRDDTGQVVQGGSLSVFDLRVGDCFDEPAGSQVSHLVAVPCAEPHDNEAFAIFDLDDGDYPGEEAVDGIAEEGCLAAFADYVGIDYAESVLAASTFTPTAASWKDGDREVVCFLQDLEGSKLSGSMAGAQR